MSTAGEHAASTNCHDMTQRHERQVFLPATLLLELLDTLATIVPTAYAVAACDAVICCSNGLLLLISLLLISLLLISLLLISLLLISLLSMMPQQMTVGWMFPSLTS